MAQEARYSFTVVYFDPNASLEKVYQLMYYTVDNTLEMFDVKNRRTFLKRTDYPSVKLRDLYIGAIVTVYARQLKIVDYADEFTASQLEKSAEMCCLVIRPKQARHFGKILTELHENGIMLHALRMLQLGSAANVIHMGSATSEDIDSLSIALQLKGDSSLETVQKMAESSSLLGKSNVYVSATSEQAAKDFDLLFGPTLMTAPANTSNCSLCLIRPHAVADGNAGKILDSLLASGFDITSVELFHLSRPNADEFLEVYQGVVPEHHDWLEEIITGKCIAAAVTYSAEPGKTVQALRAVCGATDPEIARHLHPDSLRSKFGRTKVFNAIHATDLPEDGSLEVEYFFSVLQNK